MDESKRGVTQSNHTQENKANIEDAMMDVEQEDAGGGDDNLDPGDIRSPRGLLSLLIDVITSKSSVSNLITVLRAPGLDVNGWLKKRLRPLHYAAYTDNHKAVYLLIHHGADPNLADETGYTPLHLAAKHGRVESVNALLAHGPVVNFDRGHAGQTATSQCASTSRALDALTINPLSLALDNNHVECGELLLKAGADPNRQYFLGTELTLIPLENLQCVQLVLRYGAYVDAYCRSGMTSLMKACRFGYQDAARLLLQYGADVNKCCHEKLEPRRALHYAALKGNVSTAGILLDAGAEMGVPPGGRYAPLDFAITQDHPEVVELLLSRGCDVLYENSDDSCPIQVACSTVGLYHAKRIICALLKHGADPNQSRSNNILNLTSPCLGALVEYLTYNDYYEIDVIRALIQHGAVVNFRCAVKRFTIVDPGGVLEQFHKLQTRPIVMRLLMEAGGMYDPHAIKADPAMSDEQKTMLLEEAAYTRTLLHYCRLAIRRALRRPLPDHVPELPIPEFLQQYLVFKV